MAEKFDFNPNRLPGTNDSTVKLQTSVASLLQWAGMVEHRMQQLQESLLNLVGSFDGLVGMLINEEPITVESITEKRELFLARVQEIREESRNARKAKSNIWVPPDNKIVPAVE